MALKAALFDFGGTLLDMESDRRAHLATYDHLSEKHQLPIQGRELYDAMETEIGPRKARAAGKWVSLKDLTRDAFFVVLPSLGYEVGEQDWSWFWGAYLSLHRQYLVPRPYAASVLQDARALGLHVGLLSDVDQEFLGVAMEALHLRDAFDAVTTSDEVRLSKPARQMFLTALEKARCAPREAAYVGDSLELDVAGAKALGMTAIHYAEDACRKADFCVPNHQEISRILRELCGAA